MADREIEMLRQEIAGLLPVAMTHAADSYRRFALGGADDTADDTADAKEFQQHHAACRAALVHLDALVRLARWAAASPNEAAATGEAELARMVAAARAALTRHPAHPEDEA